MEFYNNKYNTGKFTAKEKEYDVYIRQHRSNVVRAFNEYGTEILGIMKNESLLSNLKFIVGIHDNSKFSIHEFEGYRKRFFPEIDEDPSLANKAMDAAWLHHMNTNMHHPEYWILRDREGDKPLDMPRVHIAEMMLDWIGMGYKFNNTALDWFKSRSDYYKKIMTPNTYHTVNLVLNTIFNKGGI